MLSGNTAQLLAAAQTMSKEDIAKLADTDGESVIAPSGQEDKGLTE